MLSHAAISTVEAVQTVKGFTVTVAGLKDGDDGAIASDGTTVALSDGASATTQANGLSYSVTDSVATVMLTPAAGLSEADAAQLIAGLSYTNTDLDDPTAGTRTVSVTGATDSGGGTATLSDLSSTVTVTPVEDAPTAADVIVAVDQHASTNLSLLANDDDPGGDALSVTSVTVGATSTPVTNGTVVAGAYGHLTLSTDGSYTYVADIEGKIAVGSSAADTFDYAISDGQGGTASAQLKITVTETGNGNGGDNILNGLAGADIMIGGAGSDTFVFSTVLGSGNVDRLADFSAPDDMIQLTQGVFSALTRGELAEAAFKDLSLEAVDASDRILSDKTTGALSYDADGSGSKAAVQFAVVGANTTLTHADFLVA